MCEPVLSLECRPHCIYSVWEGHQVAPSAFLTEFRHSKSQSYMTLFVVLTSLLIAKVASETCDIL
jgi:hypothetical protein